MASQNYVQEKDTFEEYTQETMFSGCFGQYPVDRTVAN